jgi:hypothetical protein
VHEHRPFRRARDRLEDAREAVGVAVEELDVRPDEVLLGVSMWSIAR